MKTLAFVFQVIRMLPLATTAALLALPLVAEAKRAAPVQVTAVVKDGVEYTAPHEAMGFVVALDAATKKELWRVQVYVVKKDPDLEGDVQDIFITRLEREKARNTLIVTDERGRRFRLDLTTRKVTALPPQERAG